MTFAIPPAPIPLVPVEGSPDPFPVRRIYCVGRNYAAHAIEMGSDPTRDPPFFFAKPADAVVPLGGDVAYPPKTADYQPECELVVALKSGGADIPVDQALSHVFGYAVGFDMTRRDLQSAARKDGRPWDMSKGFDASAPISALRRAAPGEPAPSGPISLSVNGAVRQNAKVADMTWNVAEIIAHLSGYVTLAAGDLIFTGTPEGVAPVTRGDRLEGVVEGVGTLTVVVV